MRLLDHLPNIFTRFFLECRHKRVREFNCGSGVGLWLYFPLFGFQFSVDVQIIYLVIIFKLLETACPYNLDYQLIKRFINFGASPGSSCGSVQLFIGSV